MTAYPASVIALAKQPSGFVPLIMSLAALAVVIGSVATAGAVRQADESAAAHIFQFLIVSELPVLAFFVLRWFGKDLRAALTILAIQVAAIGVALFPVWRLGL